MPSSLLSFVASTRTVGLAITGVLIPSVAITCTSRAVQAILPNSLLGASVTYFPSSIYVDRGKDGLSLYRPGMRTDYSSCFRIKQRTSIFGQFLLKMRILPVIMAATEKFAPARVDPRWANACYALFPARSGDRECANASWSAWRGNRKCPPRPFLE